MLTGEERPLGASMARARVGCTVTQPPADRGVGIEASLMRTYISR